jgi:hypothetical protein
MIERLTTGLRRLASMPARELADSAGARIRGDCADALRLELDCPQQSLSGWQRAELSRLSDMLEHGGASGAALTAAARRACIALGVVASALIVLVASTARVAAAQTQSDGTFVLRPATARAGTTYAGVARRVGNDFPMKERS